MARSLSKVEGEHEHAARGERLVEVRVGGAVEEGPRTTVHVDQRGQRPWDAGRPITRAIKATPSGRAYSTSSTSTAKGAERSNIGVHFASTIASATARGFLTLRPLAAMEHAMRRMLLGTMAMSALIAGCVTESHRTIEAPTVASHGTAYGGPRYTLMVGKFQNRSTYMRGIFSEAGPARQSGEDHPEDASPADRAASWSSTATTWPRSRRRRNSAATAQALNGAQVAVTGDVTEFGRAVTGDTQLFGILGYGKKQLAYAKVALNIVDVHTSEIIYSVQGAGEYELEQPRGGRLRPDGGLRRDVERQGAESRHHRGREQSGRRGSSAARGSPTEGR